MMEADSMKMRKYVYGEPFETEAVVRDIEISEGNVAYGEVSLEEGFVDRKSVV